MLTRPVIVSRPQVRGTVNAALLWLKLPLSWKRAGSASWRLAAGSAHGDALLLLGLRGVGKDALGDRARPRSHPPRLLGGVLLFFTAQALLTGLVKAQAEGRREERSAFFAEPQVADRRRARLHAVRPQRRPPVLPLCRGATSAAAC